MKPTRLAGLLYVIVVVAGVFTLKIVPDQIIVPGDAAATADHLRASETPFRFAMLPRYCWAPEIPSACSCGRDLPC